LRASPLCTCHRHYPGAATGRSLRSLPQSWQPSPHWRTGRPAHCPFRGLLSVHSRYGLHTRWITQGDPLHRRLQPLRCLHDCSDCFRLERKLPGGTLTHRKDAAFARRTPTADPRADRIEPRYALSETPVTAVDESDMASPDQPEKCSQNRVSDNSWPGRSRPTSQVQPDVLPQTPVDRLP
jgi:hypothetical protein